MSVKPSHRLSFPLNMDRVEKDYRMVSVHLKKAHQSNELATRLLEKGFTNDAVQQSRLTKVLIRNALHRVNQQCQGMDP